MAQIKPEEVRELLRQVPCPGRSRDIVALGFVHGVGVQGPNVMVEFRPDTTNVAKILAMEEAIREVLRKAAFQDIELETEPPYDDASMLLGGASANPLQVDLAEYGIEPTPDIVEGEGRRARNLLSPEPPQDGSAAAQLADDAEGSFEPEGPQGNADPAYDGPLPVFQWQIDPQTAGEQAPKIRLSMDNWNYVVCWVEHSPQELVYASIQARHWISLGGKARPNPAGRTEGVNLVYDRHRAGVVAIYGTVKDFRPFVEAFRRAFTGDMPVGDASPVSPPE